MAGDVLQITPDLAIDLSELQFEFVRSSGPGGQNVNKVATAVQLRFDLENSSLPVDIRKRLEKIAGKRISQDNVLILEASQFRTQTQNRQDAIDRLTALVQEAARKPKKRRKTQPSVEAKRRRLEAKRRRSDLKKLRRDIPPE